MQEQQQNPPPEEETDGGIIESNTWQRDPEKERDKLLGFFVMADQPIPRDIFHSIMSFIPAFPFYFMLRSVCSQWLYEFQEQVYGNVTYLNLVDDGRPKFYVREDDQIVQFKPIGGTGRGYRMDSKVRCYRRHSIFAFLANVFCNVKHLKLGLCSFSDRGEFLVGVEMLLPNLKQLETLDVLGTKYSHHFRRNDYINLKDVYTIACSLPRSTKNLNFIGLHLPADELLILFSLFSKKARDEMVISDDDFVRNLRAELIEVDIQSLTLNYSLLDSSYVHLNISTFAHLKNVFPHFEVSVVEPETQENRETDLHLPVVSYVQYLNYLSKKEGIVLLHMNRRNNNLSEEMIEATVDIAVREHSLFKPLLALSGQKKLFQLDHYLNLDSNLVCRNINVVSKVLELLTDISRMKYPELVFDINKPFDWAYLTTYTLLGVLISECSTNAHLSMIKIIIERFKPELVVNGVRNFLVGALLDQESSPVRFKLIQYLLSLRPDLISLGDSSGKINGEQKELPLIQLCLTSDFDNELEDIQYLVEKGASLTVLDESGNNVLHSACLAHQIDIVEYLISNCPENILYAKNKNNETPLQLMTSTKHLERVAKLSCFSQDQSLKNYPTSFGNLLHAAMANYRTTTIQWLLDIGFDPNALNEKGETPLFLANQKNSKVLPRHFARRFLKHSAPENFIDEICVTLIKAGAKVDVLSNDGDTIVTSAIRNYNYQLINYLMLNPSISSKPLSEFLSPRMKHGFNALHYLFKFLSNLTDAISKMNKRRNLFTCSSYPVVKHCALLCLGHYPEMLYEKSEKSTEKHLEDISGLSPLQILLEASNGVQLMDELSIKMRDIANKPVFASKNPDEFVPLPVMYLAQEVAIDVPMFDKLMDRTHNVFIRDESQDSKPNLLHIAAQRDASLCQCIIKHWRRKCKTKAEVSKLISQSLDNDVVDGRKPRNAAILACEANMVDAFSIIWPYTSPFADQFDNPVDIAFAKKYHDLALIAAVKHNIVPTKHQLHRIIRRCLSHHNLNLDYEKRFVTLMIATEEKEASPSWLELMTQIPSAENENDELACGSLTTLQLLVNEVGSHMFDWLVRHHEKDPLLDHSVKAVDPKTGNTLLHLLAKYPQNKFVGNEWSSILFSIVSRFRNSQNEPRRTTRTKGNRPSFDDLKLEEVAQFINIQNKSGRTCLHVVSLSSSKDILQDLLEFGADTNIRDSNDQTPIDLMSDKALIDITRQFLKNKKDSKKSTKRKKREIVEESNEDNNDDEDPHRSKRRKRTRRSMNP